MSESKDAEMSEVSGGEESGLQLSEAPMEELAGAEVPQDVKAEQASEGAEAGGEQRGEGEEDGEKVGSQGAVTVQEQGHEPGEEKAGPEELHTSSGNVLQSIEADKENMEVQSEALSSDAPETVKQPPFEFYMANQTKEAGGISQGKTAKDESEIPMNEAKKAHVSEVCLNNTTKEETVEETVSKEEIQEAEVTQAEDNGQKVPLMQDKAVDKHAVNENQSFSFDDHLGDGDESGTEEEQAAFMKELENFFRERSLEFKPPKFYGEGLNCLKLWRAVTKLGGYDQVTSCKLWRQVGESFNPPKTCTTVSWSFRCFYEKALLDYERHKVRGGELHVDTSPLSEPAGVDNQVSGSQASGSGRARRDAAARAMQGWHSQRLLGNGEVGDPIIKDKSSLSFPKREKHLKSLNLLKRKKASSLERAVKVARNKGSGPRDVQIGSQAVRMDPIVADIGPPADWVKINVRRTKDCYEVYALVPGLLREEVRVQSDASGRLVISGEPEQPENPWGVTPFKKVISLPSRIDAHQTSAVVTLHGQLFVRAPFESSDL